MNIGVTTTKKKESQNKERSSFLKQRRRIIRELGQPRVLSSKGDSDRGGDLPSQGERWAVCCTGEPDK